MAITTQLIFAGLITESIMLSFLLFFPFPLTLRYKSFVKFKSWKLHKRKEVQILLAFYHFIISLLFIDSIQSIHKYSTGYHNLPQADLLNNNLSKEKKFHYQRDMYLSGFILFLSCALITGFMLVDSITKYKMRLTEQIMQRQEMDQLGEQEEVSLIQFEKLQQDLKSKETDKRTLMKQLKNLQTQFDQLNPDDQLNTVSKKDN